jgi:hypothetical protein
MEQSERAGDGVAGPDSYDEQERRIATPVHGKLGAMPTRVENLQIARRGRWCVRCDEGGISTRCSFMLAIGHTIDTSASASAWHH